LVTWPIIRSAILLSLARFCNSDDHAL